MCWCTSGFRSGLRPGIPILKRMIHAHYIHHAKHTKEDCEAFGFLYAPREFDAQSAKKSSS